MSRVNHWKELVETWHVDGVIIHGVLFCSLKEIKIKPTEIWHKTNLCENYMVQFVNSYDATSQPLQQ